MDIKTTMLKLKVFIIHAAFLEYRKPLVESLMGKLNESNNLKVDYEYVLENDPEKINLEDVQKMISLTKTNKSEFFDQLVRNIHIKQVSNALKHMTALQKAAGDSGNYDFYVFIEDDVIYGEDVAKRVYEALQETKTSGADVMFLGLPSLAPISSDKTTSKPTKEMFKVLPCCDSYAIKPSAVKKILEQFAPVRFSTNIQLSYIIDSTPELSARMIIPNVFLDGSKFGVYISSLESNNRLFLNPDYNKLSQLVKKETYNKEDHDNIKNALSSIRFKNHPDVMYLAGLYDLKNGEYSKAKDTFENVYNIYTQNGSLLNGESEFLQSYMGTFKHFQSVEA